jgi:hypothetical protein
MGEWLVTNVARVTLSCTCLPRIIHEGMLEKDINRELFSFRSQCKFSFEMYSKFEVLALTLTRSTPWVPGGPKRISPGSAGSPPGVQRRKVGTDHRTVVVRPRRREYRKASALAGCGKTMWIRQNVDGPHV